VEFLVAETEFKSSKLDFQAEQKRVREDKKKEEEKLKESKAIQKQNKYRKLCCCAMSEDKNNKANRLCCY